MRPPRMLWPYSSWRSQKVFKAIQEVQLAAPGSQMVRATMNTLRVRAGDEARNRLENEARSRIGGLLARRVQPERRPRPAAC